MSSIFDTHCHPQFPQYKDDHDEVIRRTLGGGVFMICVGTDLETSKQAIELSQKHNGIWSTVGAHPNDLDNVVIDEFVHLMNEEKIVAVGEVGLDYYRTTEKQKQKRQKDIFGQFINFAYQYQKPLVLHLRDSHKDAIEILNSAKDIFYGGVAHSFTGTLDEAKKYLDLGLFLGFNGIITFARQYDEVVKYVPMDRILIETDAPYLTPQPHRGQRNEPLYVKEVAKKVAELKNTTFEDVVEQTTQNTLKLFKISL